MYELLLICHVIVALLLIVLVLLQQGKGAQAGATLGGNASQTVFGSQGASGFMNRLTGILAALFFLLTLSLGYWVNKQHHSISHRKVAEEKIQ